MMKKIKSRVMNTSFDALPEQLLTDVLLPALDAHGALALECVGRQFTVQIRRARARAATTAGIGRIVVASSSVAYLEPTLPVPVPVPAAALSTGMAIVHVDIGDFEDI